MPQPSKKRHEDARRRDDEGAAQARSQQIPPEIEAHREHVERQPELGPRKQDRPRRRGKKRLLRVRPKIAEKRGAEQHPRDHFTDDGRLPETHGRPTNQSADGQYGGELQKKTHRQLERRHGVGPVSPSHFHSDKANPVANSLAAPARRISLMHVPGLSFPSHRTSLPGSKPPSPRPLITTHSSRMPTALDAPATLPFAVEFGRPVTMAMSPARGCGLELHLPLLGGGPRERLFPGATRARKLAGLQLFTSGDLLLGCATEPVRDESMLALQTQDLYRRVLTAVRGHHLYRIWNYIPGSTPSPAALKTIGRFARAVRWPSRRRRVLDFHASCRPRPASAPPMAACPWFLSPARRRPVTSKIPSRFPPTAIPRSTVRVRPVFPAPPSCRWPTARSRSFRARPQSRDTIPSRPATCPLSSTACSTISA